MTEPAPEQIRLMLVDDHAVVRAGLRSYADAVPGFVVVGEAVDGTDALERLAELARRGRLPEVVLMDLVLPGIDGIQAGSVITARYPTVKILIMTSFSESGNVRRAVDAGLSGYLLKDAGSDEIVAAVRAAARGELYLDSAITRCLTGPVDRGGAGLDGLTPREREVLLHLAKGLSNIQIANRLQISERTARTHVSNLFAKLGVASRTQAALLAVREGLTSERA
ncbi:response regulator transcription factor [Amycolatopsis rhabdoformis]|uniref:Response regulator transcription factor n=1 Tax=Amycolatopsis rhabdoformis TaxID=1448059 RepID=A0ABZ1IDT0_9PSEU|nr:response regulator transcription factor [Amycolatopsis rhabdoformis]WSE32422.1 response regulator transcription factor [Amycolatopsis rhabdoformis]